MMYFRLTPVILSLVPKDLGDAIVAVPLVSLAFSLWARFLHEYPYPTNIVGFYPNLNANVCADMWMVTKAAGFTM
jgi:hypothetical protein